MIGQLFLFVVQITQFLPTYLGNSFKFTYIIVQVELGFHNAVLDDIFYASGYDIRGYVVAQVIFGNIPFQLLKGFNLAAKEFNTLVSVMNLYYDLIAFDSEGNCFLRQIILLI